MKYPKLPFVVVFIIKDRNHFIYALLEYWYEEYTAGVPTAVGRDGGTAEERLARLMQLVHEPAWPT